VLDLSEFKHERVDHNKELVDKQDKARHINGIENFCNQAKRILRRYNGIPRQHFHHFIKECELRFNHSTPSQQPKTLKRWFREEGVF